MDRPSALDGLATRDRLATRENLALRPSSSDRRPCRSPGLDRGQGPGRTRRPIQLALGLALVLLPAAGLEAAPAPTAFPSAETFRQIRLAALACGRENTVESCDKARKLADPLIDHPRLPASCVDALWAITQRAKVATSNSLARRDAIDAPAQDVRVFCKQQPVRSKEKEKAPASPFGSGGSGGGSGFGFGTP